MSLRGCRKLSVVVVSMELKRGATDSQKGSLTGNEAEQKHEPRQGQLETRGRQESHNSMHVHSTVKTQEDPKLVLVTTWSRPAPDGRCRSAVRLPFGTSGKEDIARRRMGCCSSSLQDRLQ